MRFRANVAGEKHIEFHAKSVRDAKAMATKRLGETGRRILMFEIEEDDIGWVRTDGVELKERIIYLKERGRWSERN